MTVNYPWKDLHPQSGFVIEQPEWISDIDQQILLNLYQPIIGPISYALYFTFFGAIKKDSYISDEISHAEIMEQLVLGKEQFVRARMRLESIGLLQVFTNNNRDSQIANRYVLRSPLAVADFFKDSIMSTLLLDRIGEKRYEQLIDKFSLPNQKHDDWTETTSTFQDVYRVPNQFYILDHDQDENLVKKGKNRQAVAVSDMTFSMPYFTELLQGSFVQESAITTEVREMTLALHQLYGYDEVDLQRFALSATDVRTNTINVRQYQNEALEYAENQSIQARNANQQQIIERSEISIEEEKKIKAEQRHLWEEQGLTDDDFDLVELVKEYPPIDFIRNIKEQRNGFLTKGEGNTIKEILDKGILDPATLNVMSYYYLVEQEHNGLSKPLMEKTADDWGQHDVNSPESAILYLQGRLDKQKKNEIERMEKAKYKKYSGRGKSNHVEVKPDWFNQPSESNELTDENKHTEAIQSVEDLKALIAGRHKDGE